MADLVEGWEVAPSPPGAYAGPAEIAALPWRAAAVPGTAAGAVGADGRDFDAEDWWFRSRFQDVPAEPGEKVVLELDGVATVAEIFFNGQPVLQSESMWAVHSVDVTALVAADNELVIVCRALGPRLAHRRRPRARWRTRVVRDGNLRWYRTMLFGRSPGFAAGPAAVGPWRPVRLVRRRGAELDRVELRPSLDGADGVLAVRAIVRGAAGPVEVSLGDQTAQLIASDDRTLAGEIRLPDVALWWPHTHGAPALHEVVVRAGGAELARRRVGFRLLSWDGVPERDGLELRVNGVPIFVRGAVWTPPDLIGMAAPRDTLRTLLERVCACGMNMLRVVGTGAYEAPDFYDLCDELGILVWQDFMFANLDYPVEDPEFRAGVEGEARQVLAGLAGRASVAVLCGNSEVEQQPAMMGLDPALGRSELWEELLPRLVRESGADAAYVRSTPVGGELPFHANAGISHYFGVSGYFRPPDDARRAEVRFAAECLAFANVPEHVEVPVHHPRWKEGVPRDAGTGWDTGAGWDFDDVRDYYLGLLHRLDPVQLRRSDHERYLELSRAVSGEVMAEVMGEWRREQSPCRGALVLWLKDMLPGAGLGVLDHSGEPKVAYHHLRRALAPIAVWSTDEGVNGVAVHVANDRPDPLHARLRVALYRDLEARLDEAYEDLELPPHGSATRTVEGLLGRFVDAAWAYRFGSPAQDAIVLSLERPGEPRAPLSQSVRFTAGRPRGRESAAQLGLEATAGVLNAGLVPLVISCRRLAYGVRVQAPGFAVLDDAFTVEPGVGRTVQLRATDGASELAGATLTALNLDGSIKVTASQP